MLPQFILNLNPVEPMTYPEFRDMTIKEIKDVNPDDLEGIDRKYLEYRKINIQRGSRLEKHFKLSEELSSTINLINEKQYWIVITESWCGDSAQILPIIAKAAELNDNISLQIILRDNNPQIMELYLTNGKSKSIPVFIGFNSSEKEIFRWGPRPETAKNLVADLRTAGADNTEVNKQLHLWYGRNRGKDFEKELITLLKFSLAENKTK